MKKYLIGAFALICSLQIAGVAQSTTVLQKDTDPCAKFRMPRLKPNFDGGSYQTIKPNNKIDYKIIIINPCATAATLNLFGISPKPDAAPSLFGVPAKPELNILSLPQITGEKRNGITWTYFGAEKSLQPQSPASFLPNVPK